jgi:hypothetical protein
LLIMPDEELAASWAQRLTSDSNAIPFLIRALMNVGHPDAPTGPGGLGMFPDELDDVWDTAWARHFVRDSSTIPFLVRALRRDSWVGAAYYRKVLWPRLPAGIRRHLRPPAVADRSARHAAALLLGQMGATAQPAIPALIRSIKGDDVESVRARAAWALGGVGKGNRAAIAALTDALKQKEYSVRYYAARALLRIDPEAVEAQYTGEILNTRIEVAVALGELGKAAKPAAPAVTALLRDTNPIIRNLATNALLKIDPQAAAKAGVKGPSP